jgi:hypothetical protein
MLGSSAPYVVTLLASVFTWTVTSFFNDMSQVSALMYHETRHVGPDAKPYVEYIFTNVSPRKHLASFSVSIDCIDRASPCFENGQATGGQTGLVINIPPWSVTEGQLPTAQSVRQAVDLPVDQSFALRATLKSADAKTALLISTDPDVAAAFRQANLLVTDRITADLYIARNYVPVIGFLWALAAFILLAVYLLPRRPEGPKPPEVIHVVISGGLT